VLSKNTKRWDYEFTVLKFGRVAIKTWPYHVSGFISHGVRTGTASDWQMAILGAVDHQIEDRMVKKRPEFIEYNRNTAIIACALSFTGRNYYAFILCLFYRFKSTFFS